MTNEVMKIRSHAYFTACKRKTSQRRRTVRSHTSTRTCISRHWKGQEAEVSESKVPVSVCSKHTIKWFQLFPHSCLHVLFISTLILFLNPQVILSSRPRPICPPSHDALSSHDLRADAFKSALRNLKKWVHF